MGVTIGSSFHLMQAGGEPCQPAYVIVDNPPSYDRITAEIATVDAAGQPVHRIEPDLRPDVDTFEPGTYHDASLCPLA